MIDWHTHILPSMDDGSKSPEESIDMLRIGKDGGVGTVVLTPHFYPHKEDPERFLRRRDRSLTKLKASMEAPDADADRRAWPALIPGAEVYYFNELAAMDQRDLEKLCIGDSNYLMIELPAKLWNEDVYTTLEALIYNRRFIPVLAHIDRYFHLIKDKKPLMELVSGGMLIQMNVEALEGFFPRGKALKWIDDGLVHILASDCHNSSDRLPNLHKGQEILKGRIDESAIGRLVSFNPFKNP